MSQIGYWIELKTNTRHPTAALLETTTNSTFTLDGIDGIGWHLMLPRVAYIAILFGLISLAAHHYQSSGQETWRVRLVRTTSLLLVLDALLLGPLSPPALISMSMQFWLLLQLRDCLQQVKSNAESGTACASPIDPALSPPRRGVRYLDSIRSATSDSSGGDNCCVAVGLYGEVALFTALWLLTGRQYFFITGHTNAFAKIDVTASFVGFHGMYLRAPCMYPFPLLLTCHSASFVAGLPDVHSEVAKLRSVILVVINTFGTQIAAWASCALLSTQLKPSDDNSGDADCVQVFDHTFTVRLHA